MKNKLLNFLLIFSIVSFNTFCLDPKGYYSILGIPESATSSQIKNAYKELAKKWHPDKWTTKSVAEQQQAAEKFIDIHTAYKILIDPEKRKIYTEGKDLPEDPEEFDLKRQQEIFSELTISILIEFTDDISQPETLKLIESHSNDLIDDINKYKNEQKILSDRILDDLRIILADGVIKHLINKKPISARLSNIIQNKVNHMKKIPEKLKKLPSLKDRQDLLDNEEVFYTPYSFFSKDIRDMDSQFFIQLVIDYKNDGQIEEAKQLAKEVYENISNNWGKRFPVSPVYENKLKELAEISTTNQLESLKKNLEELKSQFINLMNVLS